jgi:hypothetical protein
MQWLKENLYDSTGSEIAESAVVLPLVFMLLLGIMWFGRAFNIYSTLNRAAREAAVAAAAPSCATCGNVPRTQSDIQNNVVDPILRAAHLDPSQLQITDFEQDVALTPAENGSKVSLSYPWNFKLNWISVNPWGLQTFTTGVTIAAESQARQEN